MNTRVGLGSLILLPLRGLVISCCCTSGLVVLVVKNPPARDAGSIRGKEMQVRSPGKIPWRRAWQPTPVFLPGESHRQRSHKKSDTAKVT